MDEIRIADLVGVVDWQGFDIGQQFGAGNAPDTEVHCLALDVVAVFRRAGKLVIVGLTAHSAGNRSRSAKMRPNPGCQPDKRFVRLHREPAAAPTGAPKLSPGEIADILPEVLGGVNLDTFHRFLPGSNYLQNPLFRSCPEDAVHVLLRHVRPLEVNGCPLGLFAPQPIQQAVIEAQIVPGTLASRISSNEMRNKIAFFTPSPPPILRCIAPASKHCWIW